MKKIRRVLGFDPGYGRLGFGVVDVFGGKTIYVACGVLTTPAGVDPSLRLLEIARDVRTLFEKYQPEELGIESLFFGKSSTTALRVAEVRGVLLYLAAERGMPVVEVKPVEVKMALTGYGKAKKPEMQQMITRVLGLKTIPEPDDAELLETGDERSGAPRQPEVEEEHEQEVRLRNGKGFFYVSFKEMKRPRKDSRAISMCNAFLCALPTPLCPRIPNLARKIADAGGIKWTKLVFHNYEP